MIFYTGAKLVQLRREVFVLAAIVAGCRFDGVVQASISGFLKKTYASR
jgi:hypothetical protein